MKRRLLNLPTALSLLLCVAVCVLWVAGVYVQPSLSRYHAHGRGSTRVYVNPDGLYFWKDESHYGVDASGKWDGAAILSNPEVSGLLGFGVGRDSPMFYRNARFVKVPHWFLVVATAVLPGYRLAARSRRRCPERSTYRARCGYDLRATPGRCPGCGERQ